MSSIHAACYLSTETGYFKVMYMIVSKDVNGNTYYVSSGQLSWRPAAYGVIIHDQKVLLVRHGNSYHLPGGGIALGESPDAALLREIHEETGTTSAHPRLIDSLTTFFTWKDSKDGELHHVQSLLLYYKCDFIGGVLSTEYVDEDERALSQTPTWVPLTDLEHIHVGSTIDWRSVVQAVINR